MNVQDDVPNNVVSSDFFETTIENESMDAPINFSCIENAIDLDSLHEGLINEEFFLEYLPIISLTDGRCTGAEALIRWRRPSGIVQPDNFIPIAENTPISGLMTYWLIETLAIEMRDWLLANPDADISINIPPEILGRGGLEYAARKAGIFDLVSQITLEITERGVPDLMGVNSINNMASLGVRLALDDVTLTSGANMAVLARCHFDVIKLDKSLVAQISSECPSPEWLEGITALLQSSRLVVVAEGIETEQQFMTIRTANIQLAQGFYFSKPITAVEFIDYHRENNAKIKPAAQ
ncbi:EAL domain-containing protein [Methylicorpusculum sp.]|uniref:EAL domain-containing protein n=1 Tax=Methylicorpusculum sp. TaxID=2713644 RepID=UPI0027223000|nr:EAL domain-containing protein [Methylicorpusculum sp.]MDO8846516.1 EAL domain-containing protein [Methylicorpusculum sp.]MDP2180530.1 EAL domain-containing protein [Methylicorpusculum sp.]MDP3529239.1 EAL domain-containing protein [Methylicorpusculum sp.]MDZ4153283.1 EAL domain-containing protein [Methylicorpusculum sp.]